MSDEALEKAHALAWCAGRGMAIQPEQYDFYAKAVRRICEQASHPYTPRLVSDLLVSNQDLYSFARELGIDLHATPSAGT